jgi:hypothetical protein
MRRKWRICLGAYALFAASAFAQDHRPALDWVALQSVPPDSQIRITLQDGKLLQGRFVAWSPEDLEVTSKSGASTLRVGEVRRIAIRQKSSRWKGAMIGALIGFGVGFPIGASWAGHITDRNDPGFATRAGMGAGLGMFSAGIAAPIGALTGGTKYVTVYRAKDRP